MYRPLYIVFRRYALAELSLLSPFAANITDCYSHCCCAAAMAILRTIKSTAINMVTITQTKWKPDFSVLYKNTPLLIVIFC